MPEMLVLRPFLYAANGTDSAYLPEGVTADIRHDLIAGLRGEGYIGDPPGGEAGKALATRAPRR